MATYSRKRNLPQEFDISPIAPRTPLCARSSNATKPRHPPSSHATKSKKPRLTQMTIDLGGDPHRKCKGCGMEYIPTNPEDAVLHKQYHNASVAGLDVPKGIMEKANVVYECERRESKSTTGSRSKQSRHGLDKIVQVCRRDSLSLRRLARKVLQVAEKELGAVEIQEEVLWSQVSVTSMRMGRATDAPTVADGRAALATQSNTQCDRYKVFLYIQDNKCGALCLVERIRTGRRVLPSSGVGESSSISTDLKHVPAKLGISRIWVSREMRNLGIAKGLVDAARMHFSRGVALDKEQMAWSQPTESGARLARAWFEKDDGWLVYDEHGVVPFANDAISDGRKAEEDETEL